jgi:hypothetical protein
VSSSPADSSADQGARRADDLLRLLAEGDRRSADDLLAGLDVRDLTFTGAGLTVAARAERHRLPPAMRAQANTRQMRLGQLRDAARTDPDGLRGWLVGAAEEVLFLRSLPGLDDAEARAVRRR